MAERKEIGGAKKEGELMSQNKSTIRGNQKKQGQRKSWLVRVSEESGADSSYMPNPVSQEEIDRILATQAVEEAKGGLRVKIRDIYPALAE